jgi:PAS domain S-box-containing protein
MPAISKSSILSKQTLIIVGTSAVSLILACAAFVMHELLTFRKQLSNQVATLAEVIGDNCSAAIELNNPKQAAKTLAALAAEPHIAAACVFKTDGAIFATYTRGDEHFVMPPMGKAGHEFADKHLHLFREITVDSNAVGTIYLKSDLTVLSDSIIRYLQIVGLVFALSVSVALFLSNRLQRIVSGPILHLATVARSITTQSQYSARARKQNNDELGDLVDAFNQMLSQIQERDRALQAARDTLEVRVEQRTGELEHSLSVLHATFEATAEGIVVVDANGKVVSYNEKFVKMWGLPTPIPSNSSGTELISKVAQNIKDADACLARMRQLYSEPDAESHDLVEFKDGRVFERYSQPQRIGGRSVGRVWSFRDVTERKVAEESLRKSDERFQLVARATNDAVWDWDIPANTLWWNQGFKTLFGYKDEENQTDLTSRTERMHPEDRDRIMEGIRRVIEGPETYWASEYRFRRADGSYAYIYDRGYVMRAQDGRPLRMVGAMVDITQRRQSEEEVLRARDLAEAANRAKSQFLANVSHEIRTPMNAIIGMTNFALETNLSGEQRSLLLTVQDSADTLLNIINDILDFSKVEAGKMELQPIRFNLRERLEDTVSTFGVRAREKGLELACFLEASVPETVIGDPGRLRQVLVNLLGNAIKFTESGEVVLRVFTEKRYNDRIVLHFAVTDTGIGIPEDKQQVIFEAFTQADNSPTRNYGGTGLGLTISSQLTDLMGGKIWVESKHGLGSTFHFTADFGVDPAAETATSEIPVLRGVRVLVVDDNATNRMVLESQLARWGMRAVCVSDGTAALQEIARSVSNNEPFRLIIIDVVMPTMDGLSLARRIREGVIVPDTTMMLLTSLGISDASARELGIKFCLTKPVHQTDLFDAVLTAVGGESDSSPGTNLERVTETSPSGETSTRHPQRKLTPRRPLKILLAEDHPVNQRLAIAILQNWGHTVEVVSNGRKAVDAFTRQSYDLIVMDVQMPELNGLEATKAIRRMEHTSGGHTPIIAMTAHAIKGDREQCLAAGMDGYVSKPVNTAELFHTIEDLLHDSVRRRFTPAATGELGTQRGSSPSLDTEKLLDRVNGDRQLLKEVVQLFFHDAEQTIENLGHAISRGNAAEVERTAHRLKGALSNMELVSGAQLASELEHMGHTNQLIGAHQLMRDIASIIAQARPVLEALFQEKAA